MLVIGTCCATGHISGGAGRAGEPATAAPAATGTARRRLAWPPRTVTPGASVEDGVVVVVDSGAGRVGDGGTTVRARSRTSGAPVVVDPPER